MSEPIPPTRRARKAADEPVAPDVVVPARPPAPEHPATTALAAGDPPVPSSASPVEAASLTSGDDADEHRLPTAQLEMAAFGPHPIAGEWVPETPARPPSVAPWALGVAIVSLIAAIFVGWMLPLGLVAVVLALISLRRRHDSRQAAVWALVLGVVSILYSASWLLWALPQLDV